MDFPKYGLVGARAEGESFLRQHVFLQTPCLRREYHQSFAQPDFRAEKKKALSGGFLLIFLCVRPKRAPKYLRQTLVASDKCVSLVKVVPNCLDSKPLACNTPSMNLVPGLNFLTTLLENVLLHDDPFCDCTRFRIAKQKCDCEDIPCGRKLSHT